MSEPLRTRNQVAIDHGTNDAYVAESFEIGRPIPRLSNAVTIPAEHRTAVALALLGGITDELVKKAIEGALNGPGINDDADWGAINAQVEPLVRGAINAVFGISEP